MSAAARPDTDDRLPLARATIIALYAMAGVAPDLATAAPLWLPGLHPVTIDEALRRMAALRPGITCVPFPTGRDIAIGVWEGRTVSDFKADVLDLVREGIAERSPQDLPSEYEVVVRSKAGGDTATLTWAQYDLWCREFELIAPTIQMNAVPSAPGQDTPRLIVTVSPPSADGWVSGTYL